MTYTEVVVTRKTPGWMKLSRNVCVLMGVVSALGVLFSWLFLISAAALWILAHQMTQKLDIEFQYYHLGNDFDVAMVLGGKKRKELGTINLDRVLLVAPVDSERAEEFDHWETVDYSAQDPKQKPWVMICTRDNGRSRCLIQMNDALYNSLRRQIPGKVFKD